VFAIVVAFIVARESSKDAEKQVKAIYNLLDVFVAANNPNIENARLKYLWQLADIDSQIKKVKDLLDIRRNPFRDDEIELQEKAERRRLLNQLVDKRKEIERNLSLIEDYFKKTCSE
jgi:hypothetical protein